MFYLFKTNFAVMTKLSRIIASTLAWAAWLLNLEAWTWYVPSRLESDVFGVKRGHYSVPRY